MNRKTKTTVIWAGIITGLVLGCVMLVTFAVRSLTTDYSSKPAPEVYKSVFRQDVPRGVTNLRVAGHGYWMSHAVWMKYAATDGAINALLTKSRYTLEGPDESFSWISKEQISNNADARAVGWDEVLKIKHRRSYTYEAVENFSGWTGEIVIDRANHTVYVYALSM